MAVTAFAIASVRLFVVLLSSRPKQRLPVSGHLSKIKSRVIWPGFSRIWQPETYRSSSAATSG